VIKRQVLLPEAVLQRKLSPVDDNTKSLKQRILETVETILPVTLCIILVEPEVVYHPTVECCQKAIK